MHDYKYYILVSKEHRAEIKDTIARKNQILRMTNPKRKQEEWSKLFNKLALEGLTEEQLNQPY